MPVQSLNLHQSGKRHKVITSSSHREITEEQLALTTKRGCLIRWK